MNIINWPIRIKLLVSYGTIFTMSLILGIFAYNGISEIQIQNSIGEKALQALVDAEEAQANALRYIIYGDADFYEEMDREMDDVHSMADEAAALMHNQANIRNTLEMKEAAEAYEDSNHQYYEADVRKKEAGAIRAEKALEILSDLIEVIDSSKEYALNSQISYGSSSYLEKSAVERVWLM